VVLCNLLATVGRFPDEQFEQPLIEDPATLKPVLAGIWQGGEYATSTNGKKIVTGGVHSILKWLDKDDPRGPKPENPDDSQFERWEYSIRIWAQANNLHEDKPFILN
jgi:hypothetical protein